VVRRANVFDTDFEFDPADPAGYRSGVARLSQQLKASEQALKAFEIPPGASLCPYHYEYVEEWLLVLEGTVTVRVPEGEEQLRRGDVVCFPAGPDGAHKVSNPGQQPARLIMFSSSREPSVAVYPDSDKIGVWVPNPDDHVILRRADGHVDYYDGEV
jgi:uncharacterized cupin superfamily protein